MPIKNENHTNKLTKSEILGLDIAQKCGYFTNNERGTWDFTESKKRNNNKQHKAFRDTLIEFINKNGIKQVVAEDVNVRSHFAAMRKLSEFRGILLEICDELDLPQPEFINVTQLKKWATGDGQAKKDKMIEAMKVKYGLIPGDDNEADACHIFHYFCRKYHIVN